MRCKAPLLTSLSHVRAKHTFAAQDCSFHFSHSTPSLLWRLRRNQLVGAIERLKCSCIGPPPFEDVVVQPAFVDISLVDVGDLKLAAGRGFERSYNVEDLRVVEIDARYSIIGLGFLGFLFDADYLTLSQFGNAKALGVRDLLKEDSCTSLLCGT